MQGQLIRVDGVQAVAGGTLFQWVLSQVAPAQRISAALRELTPVEGAAVVVVSVVVVVAAEAVHITFRKTLIQVVAIADWVAALQDS